MKNTKPQESRVIKIQKLRRAIDRIRHVRAEGESPRRKASWLTRLKARLGWGEDLTKTD